MSEILTSAHAGSTATRLRRGFLATVVAGFALLSSLTVAPAFAAATPTPSPTLSGEVATTLSPVGSGVFRPGETLGVTVTVDNGTTTDLQPAVATLFLGNAPLPDRASLEAWLSGASPSPEATAVTTALIESLPSGEAETVGMTVSPSDPALTGRVPGVYPLWTDITGRISRSVMVVPAEGAPAVGVVVPITAGAQQSALLSATRLEDLTGADGALTAQLDAVAGTNAILAVDPAIPAAIRALGTRAPATAVAWLDRLESLPNSRFALQFGDADVSPQLAAGLPAPLQPTSLTFAMRAADFPAPTPTPTPDAQADADTASAVPDLQTLLGIGTAPVTAYWPSTGSTGPGTVGALAAASPEALTLVSSTSTAAGAGGGFVPARGTTPEGAQVLVYDTAVSTALAEAAGEPDPTLRGTALATASAQLWFAAGDAAASGQPLLVAVDRGAEPTRAGLRSAISAATNLDGATALDLTALAVSAPVELELTEGAPDADRTAAVPELLRAEDAVARFATILNDPALLTGQQRAETLQLLGASWAVRATAWPEAYEAYRARVTETLGSVSIVPTTSINLLTAGTNLKFWVHNSLPYPATVTLSASPDDLRLSVDPQTVVTLAAADSTGGSNTPVEVPVRARIANGEVQITLSLHGPTGEPIGGQEIVDVKVRADWENVGLVLMAVLVAGFLTIGVIRTVRRRRAIAAEGDAAATATIESEDSEIDASGPDTTGTHDSEPTP